MNIETKNNDLILENVSDFNLTHIFDCGQCFRFNQNDDGTYTGVAKGKALTISQTHDTVILYDTSEEDFKNIWYDFFDFDRDYKKIKDTLSSDPIMADAIKFGSGIRILNQDLWEAIISFIISSSNNIPRIKGIVERLCQNFGKKIEYMGKTYYSFPTLDELQGVTADDLSVIRAGFRDKYIIDAIDKFSRGILSVDYINSLSTAEAKNALMSIKGVGNKVSDCILLFGMNRANSFPVDVWIKRIMEFCYFNNEEQSVKTICDFANSKFGTLGGYAQQYLFFYARENKIGTE
ncbi:MAG: DNA-3-methyladenine glycosylase 2 family protein [Clostridia bacterium]|nr:DNA-3-methyladenine glycosylase 2 family protein [Clostridia bacterium]